MAVFGFMSYIDLAFMIWPVVLLLCVRCLKPELVGDIWRPSVHALVALPTIIELSTLTADSDVVATLMGESLRHRRCTNKRDLST